MKTLYHFTAREYLPAILTTGLNKGDVPTSATTGVNGVWLTSLPSPRGHGLSAGGVLSDENRTMHFKLFGELPPPGSRYPNKLAVRITIGELPEPSRLVRWSRWRPKNCAPGWYDSVCRANGPNHRTWWIYFAPIPLEALVTVELREGETWRRIAVEDVRE